MLKSLLVLIASSISCVVTSDIKENAPTYVPRRCFLDKAQGQCRDYTRNYFFNVNAGHCQEFVYGGCGGNWNRFSTLAECHKTCTCATPPETGPCRGHIRRWFYSPEDGCCRPFMYGGCGGNSNNYATWTECSNKCGYPTADSNWWTWGAEWGNWSREHDEDSKTSNMTYSRADFMRDWMLWMLLAGGEGFEMEDLATMIGQAHILNMVKTSASSIIGSGSSGQGSASAVGYYDNGNWQATSGMANWGPTYRTKPGSFTPLEHVGSIENVIGTDVHGSRINGLGVWDQLAASGFGDGSNANLGWGVNGEANMDFGGNGNWWNAIITGQDFGLRDGTGLGWSGHGQVDGWNAGVSSQGQRSWGSSQNQRQGLRGGSQGGWNKQSGNLGFESVMEMLYLISKLGRGMLGRTDLLNLGRRFDALGNTGDVDINLLATRMVSSLQGPKAASNLARLKGIAHNVGALDHNDNINIHLFVKGIADKFSGEGFDTSLGGGGLPTLDEFQWLGAEKSGVSVERVPGTSAGSGTRGSTGGSASIGHGSASVTSEGPLIGGGSSGILSVIGRPVSAGGLTGHTGPGAFSGTGGGSGLSGAVRGRGEGATGGLFVPGGAGQFDSGSRGVSAGGLGGTGVAGGLGGASFLGGLGGVSSAGGLGGAGSGSVLGGGSLLGGLGGVDSAGGLGGAGSGGGLGGGSLLGELGGASDAGGLGGAGGGGALRGTLGAGGIRGSGAGQFVHTIDASAIAAGGGSKKMGSYGKK